MPQGPHSLPIPDFVCQSFQQQAAGPVQQQPEAGQPPSAGSPPALKRKPGRKPKKVSGTQVKVQKIEALCCGQPWRVAVVHLTMFLARQEQTPSTQLPVDCA